MKIKKISARNLKGRSFTQELGPVTILVGQNRAGKSSRTDAIRLALAGFLPELGKQPSATFGLASGGDMSVEAELEGGQKMARAWRLTPKGKVEYDDGGCDSVPSVQLDPGEFFNLTSGKRSDYVAGLLTVDGSGTVDAIVSQIVTMKKPGDWSSEQSKSCDDALAEIADYVRDAQSSGDENSVPFFATLKSVEESLKERCSLVNANLKAAVAARDQISNSDCAQESGRNCAEDIVKKSHRVNELNRSLQTLRTQLDDMYRWSQQLESLRSSSRIDTTETEAEIARLSKEIDVLDEHNTRESREIEQLRSAVAKEIASIQVSKSIHDQRLVGLESLKRTLEHASNCPTCGTAREAWGDGAKSGMESEIEDAKRAIEATKGLFVDLMKREETLNARSKELDDSFDLKKKLGVELRSWQSKLKTYMKSNSEHDRLAGSSEQIEACIARVVQGYGVASVVHAVQTINEWIAEQTQMLTDANADLVRLREQHESFVRFQERQKEIALAGLRVEKFRIGLDAWKHGLAVVREERARLVDGALKGLADAVNLLVDDVLPYRIAFEDGEFGYRNTDDRWVSWSTWSGSEQQIGFVSVALALAAKTPHRIAIVDELGKLDVEMLYRLMKRVVSLVDSGSLDQFVGIDVENRMSSIQGVKVSHVLPKD